MKRTEWKRKPPKVKPDGERKPRKAMKRSTFTASPRELKARLEARREALGLADKAYLVWLRQQPCGLAEWALLQWRERRVVIDIGPCGNGTEADHERGIGHANPGMSQKAPDARAWSCCHDHHQERHGASKGFWADMTKQERADFIAERIDEHRANYLAQLATGGIFGGM